MSDDTTTIVYMRDHMNCSKQIEQLAMHGRTMIAMYKMTGDDKYLDRARKDYDKCLSLRGGFMRPLGATLNEAA